MGSGQYALLQNISTVSTLHQSRFFSPSKFMFFLQYFFRLASPYFSCSRRSNAVTVVTLNCFPNFSFIFLSTRPSYTFLLCCFPLLHFIFSYSSYTFLVLLAIPSGKYPLALCVVLVASHLL